MNWKYDLCLTYFSSEPYSLQWDLEVRHPRCVGSNNKGIFVYDISSLTQLYYLI